MDNPFTVDDLFHHSLTLNLTNFAQSNYEGAYHFLCACMHLATAGERLDLLSDVEKRTHDQLKAVQALSESDFEAVGERKRDFVNAYLSLTRQVESHQIIVKHRRSKKQNED